MWKARDVMLERDVAITLLVGTWQGDARASAALSRATRSAHFEHPHAARILDVVRPGGSPLPTGVLGAAVAEWTPGRDLVELVADGPLRPSTALRVIEPLADAVAAAHRSGLVLGLDHPQRVRVSTRAATRLAFPMPRGEATNADDVHGLGALLYLHAHRALARSRGQPGPGRPAARPARARRGPGARAPAAARPAGRARRAGRPHARRGRRHPDGGRGAPSRHADARGPRGRRRAAAGPRERPDDRRRRPHRGVARRRRARARPRPRATPQAAHRRDRPGPRDARDPRLRHLPGDHRRGGRRLVRTPGGGDPRDRGARAGAGPRARLAVPGARLAAPGRRRAGAALERRRLQPGRQPGQPDADQPRRRQRPVDDVVHLRVPPAAPGAQARDRHDDARSPRRPRWRR